MRLLRCAPDAMCLGAVRLLPIDVGFDLRETGTPIRLPEDDAALREVGEADQTGCGYLDRDGVPCLIHGTRAEVAAVLRAAGYEVESEGGAQ